LNCVVIHTSTGNVTSTRKQVMLAREYKAAAILTTGDYLLRIVEEARAMGLDPAEDLSIRSLATCIGNEEALEEVFGVPVLKTYGFHEVGYVSVECPAKQGLHIFEDAYHVQVVDPDSGAPVPDGTTGALVITEVYKTGSPQFRYNIMDLAALYPREQCACGSWLRRMSPFAGRGDNMVKLRGINVWPEGIGRIAASVEGATPDYFVRAVRRDGRDELVAMIATEWPEDQWPGLQEAVERRLHEQLGVKVLVEIVGAGALDALTGMGTEAKAKRFRDERGS
jgi:phenylacetate-CoA ligase